MMFLLEEKNLRTKNQDKGDNIVILINFQY